MTKLSKRAQDMLIDSTGRVGANVTWRCDPAAEDELKDLGMITGGGNLTAKGLNARSEVMDRRLDEAFG